MRWTPLRLSKHLLAKGTYLGLQELETPLEHPHITPKLWKIPLRLNEHADPTECDYLGISEKSA